MAVPVQGCRILIVEDEFMLAHELAFKLERMGATVIGPEPSIARALARIAAEPIDFAVLDVNLGAEKVFPVADRLTDMHTPFVFFTGYGHDLLPDSYRAARRCDKPVDLRELEKALACSHRAHATQ